MEPETPMQHEGWFAPPSFIVDLCTTKGTKRRWLNDRQLGGLCETLFRVPWMRDMTDAQWQKLATHLRRELGRQQRAKERQRAAQHPETTEESITQSTPRVAVQHRAGTHLLPNAYPVVIRRVHHGMLDRQQRVWQHGGEAKNFVRWSMKAITIDLAVWEIVHDLVDRLEMVDHVRNECYRVGIQDARELGTVYRDPKIGDRYAIPLSAWEILDAQGQLLREAA